MTTPEVTYPQFPRSAPHHMAGTHRSAGPRPVDPAAGAAHAIHEPDRKWDLLLVCVAGYILTAVGRIHQLFPILEVFRPAILTGGVAIVLYLVDRLEERRSPRFSIAPTKYVIALLVWMVLSVSAALVVSVSFDLVFNNFAKTVLMFLVVAGTVRGIRDVERLTLVYLVGATLYAGVVLLRFDLGTGDDWRLGRLYYYDANDFATFVVTAMPFGLYFLHAGRRTSGRILAGVALAVLTLAFVNTGSRGGFVALVAVTAFIVLRSSAIALRQRVWATALIALIVLGAASDQYWTQMSTIFSDADYNRSAESGRMQIWRRGVGYMLQHPILGVGPNNFQTAEGTLSPFAQRQQFGVGVRWNAAHNTFVQVGAELGLPGLILFVAVIASALRVLRRSGRRVSSALVPNTREPELTQALTASLIAFTVGAFFLSLAYSEMLYTLVAMVVGLERVSAGQSVRVISN
jgi:O-antigen ligase